MAKYIFDFDDVLFFNTEKFKKHMYQCFEEIGVSYDTVKKYYKIEKEKGWVLQNLVESVLDGENIKITTKEDLSEKIMRVCKEYTNTDLINRIKKLNREDCYMVTHGVKEYQLEKIQRTGVGSLFNQIFIVQDTKKDPVEMICEKFRDEEVIFVDDKEKRFADLNFEKYPNLRKVLYVDNESINKIFNE
ncbi:HAD hydrolase-like protein [Candidatus Nomurabacteria bacterium]|nr:HAD hydrolase-like protein [Candidatus Nomurabacteria bacterium]MCB9820384.1 HAD hydrolase-like protein [Candidatus Nomurabacteria bacterium]